MKTIVIGTRGSNLARAQANFIMERLKNHYPDLGCEIKIIQTTGDKFLTESFDKMEGKGVFVKEIESALLEREIDIAVHSMKDLPTEEHPDLVLAAITEREDPRDVLVSHKDYWLATLPKEALIGTSSIRRRSQLLHFRPDLKFEPIRGNVNTRLGKMRDQGMDGVILAYAGLKRLGLEDQAREIIPFNICMPAVGQGALGIQLRKDDEEAVKLVSFLNHFSTACTVTAERSMLKTLGGGCQVPIGAFGELKGTEVKLSGLVASPDGKFVLKDSLTGPLTQAAFVGRHLARRLLKKGADKLLKSNRC
ncbi:hydroxymethylbilane synthase [Candidatus Contubernalis alkaliaceticus]|uniref:hydroxymethylbilane synthase n=1 Tax=Candidatus Contubernalis alkaliaceticus TaxID=338645 RepID=UPI001F4C00C6|nr:hydroxymethylbilane synthase [Candidatus Contubernalis alkalaceticus]UNC92951.1 hydroxymethylbilane synthase [Candidatus Contubernalis alkalaceticus]